MGAGQALGSAPTLFGGRFVFCQPPLPILGCRAVRKFLRRKKIHAARTAATPRHSFTADFAVVGRVDGP